MQFKRRKDGTQNNGENAHPLEEHEVQPTEQLADEEEGERLPEKNEMRTKKVISEL